MGDFNARTGSLTPNTSTHPPRTSGDLVVNTRGRALVRLAETHGLVLASGTSGHFGAATSLANHSEHSACSVVDHCLLSPAAWALLVSGTTCPPLPEVSDHAPLHLILALNQAHGTRPGEGTVSVRWELGAHTAWAQAACQPAFLSTIEAALRMPDPTT